jgi:hypothetical protein
MSFPSTNVSVMSRTELKTLVDRCTPADKRFLLAYLRSKDPDFRRKLVMADRDIEGGRGVRLRATRRGLVRLTRTVA